MMKADPALDVLCLVDSSEGIEFLTSEWQAAGATRPLGVLVEMGRQGLADGRQVDLEFALELCRQILLHPQTLRWRGIEGFEGLAHALGAGRGSKTGTTVLGRHRGSRKGCSKPSPGGPGTTSS
jgi:D-serine deaminase-like pyridoxal phosphate-dependent protein